MHKPTNQAVITVPQLSCFELVRHRWPKNRRKTQMCWDIRRCSLQSPRKGCTVWQLHYRNIPCNPTFLFVLFQVCSVVLAWARLCLSWNWSTTFARLTEVTPSSPALASELVRVTISTTRWSPEASSFLTRRDQRSGFDWWMSVWAVAAAP